MVGATQAENIYDRVTHVIIFHNKGQEIPEKNILRSLGGQAEQDMITFSEFLSPGGAKIHVLYQDLLEDCLQAKRVLPVAGY
ncbi:hypothetical protein KC19_VG256900 [Ceratodon purpureus]|uniref:BRCT domain-containing protein n=1 Tax=Ceratodon purpureus TaxID=3225 RepID=A0A8T0HUE2_CERPU|nr:hypothetical protein KC19_VG256900 [Ceratodon purpureus]